MRETEHLAHYRNFFAAFFLILFSVNSYSQNYPDHVVDSLLRKGISDILFQNYSGAKETFNYLRNNYSVLPLGNIYLAATEIARAYDYEEPYNSDYIIENLDTAEIKANRLLDKDDNNIWYIYFKALREGYYAYYQALGKNWLSALSNGVNSVRDFEKCLSINPDFYESYTAIGAYKYWRSRKTEFLKWLPFVKDERESGIKNLQSAINHSTYHEYLAVNSLLWIYIDQKKYQAAVELAEKILKKYPSSRFILWPLARAYEEIDIKKSISIYKSILDSYSQMKNSNHYNEIVLKHIMAQQYVKLNEKKIALDLCNEILSIRGLSEYVQDKLGDRLDRVQELRKELSGN